MDLRDLSRIREYRADPCRFVWHEFGVTPDGWQQEALNAFASGDANKQRIALQACAGPGKSAVLAWCGWNFLSCYYDDLEHPKGAAVSITSDNLRDNLWAELAKWRERSKFLKSMFKWTKERIFCEEFPETWFMSARSFAKTASPEEQGRTLSGLHAKYVLYLIDESGDIGVQILKAAEQGLSNCTWGKIVTAGNPTSHSGLLYHLVNARSHKTYVVRITGDPDDPKRSARIDLEWARDQIEQEGRDNPWVMAFILGLFPPTAVNALLGPDEVRKSMALEVEEDKWEWAAKVIGVDIARFGDDRTVIFPRQGLMAFEPEVMRHARTHEVAGRVVAVKRKGNADAIFVDDTGGYGAGVVDALYLGKHPVIPVNFSSAATDKRYFNKRSEIMWEAAQWVKRGGQLPHMPEIVREATAATYWFEKGKIRVEEKDQIKRRIGVSPDLWDAFCCTFAQEVAPGSAAEAEGGGFGAKAPEPVFDDVD